MNADRHAPRMTEPPPNRVAGAALAWILIAAASLVAMTAVRPPPARPPDIAATEFSSGRAMRHVRAIAQQPHPVGSLSNQRVREYLMGELTQLGLEAHLSAGTAQGSDGRVVSLQNVLGRLPGTQPGKAVLLMCHYDSVPDGPGAADDASGVAAVLESVRAIAAGARLRNDLIVLFSDGEETGLLGARLFVQEHPWLEDVAACAQLQRRIGERYVDPSDSRRRASELAGDRAAGPGNLPVRDYRRYDALGCRRVYLDHAADSVDPVRGPGARRSRLDHTARMSLQCGDLPDDRRFAGLAARSPAQRSVACGSRDPARYHRRQPGGDRLLVLMPADKLGTLPGAFRFHPRQSQETRA